MMPEEHEDHSEDFDRPPAFFPYEGEAAAEPKVDLGEPVEVSVEGVFAADNNGSVQRFVLLSDGERRIPILIGAYEAAAISMSLEGATPDRPMTHDLLRTMIERLGGTVEKIVIDDLWSTTYYAKIHLDQNGTIQTIDSRPSDAIALALRFEASIFVAEGILEQGNEL